MSFVVAFNNYKINYNAMILSSLFFLFANFSLINYFVTYSKSVFWVAVFYNHFMPFMYLKGPLLYFYVRGSLKEHKRITIKDWFHFIPATLSFIGILPYIVSSFNYKTSIAEIIVANPSAMLQLNDNIFFSTNFNMVSRPLLFLMYTIYCLYYLFRFKAKAKRKNMLLNHSKMIYNWLFTFLIILFFTVSFYLKLCFDFVSNLSINNYIVYKWYYNVAGLFLSILALVLIFFPNVLYGLPNSKEISRKKIQKKINKLENTELELKLKKESTEMNDVDNSFTDLALLITKHLSVEKPYLQHDFNISVLAAQLKIRELHILYCYNTIFKIRFTKMKNQLRVEYAKELLSDELMNNLTIDAIGQKSGFSTRSNFYNTFKVETGCTPSEYLKSIKIEKNNLDS